MFGLVKPNEAISKIMQHQKLDVNQAIFDRYPSLKTSSLEAGRLARSCCGSLMWRFEQCFGLC